MSTSPRKKAGTFQIALTLHAEMHATLYLDIFKNLESSINLEFWIYPEIRHYCILKEYVYPTLKKGQVEKLLGYLKIIFTK